MLQLIMIYFIQVGKIGPIKIGHTMGNDIRDRFSSLQMSNPEELFCIGTIEGDRELEKTILAKFRCHRIRGEWHKPVPELLEFVKTFAMECHVIRPKPNPNRI
jgi:hypothetical protein